MFLNTSRVVQKGCIVPFSCFFSVVQPDCELYKPKTYKDKATKPSKSFMNYYHAKEPYNFLKLPPFYTDYYSTTDSGTSVFSVFEDKLVQPYPDQ